MHQHDKVEYRWTCSSIVAVCTWHNHGREVDRYEASRPSIIRVYLCLSTIWNLLQNGNMENCFMPKNGMTYMGSLNMTQSKKYCQYWDSNEPHKVDYTIKDENFPDGSKSMAKNFCRNPDPVEKSTTWCYTMSDEVEWEFCDPCAGKQVQSGGDFLTDYGSCSLPKKGSRYMGKQNYSNSNYPCLEWKDFEYKEFVFPDGSPEKARNYCRNPNPDTALGPWCLIHHESGETTQREYCDVCRPFAGRVIKHPNTYLEHGIELTLVTRESCIAWCIEVHSCVAVDFVIGKAPCHYHTSEAGLLHTDSNSDHYTIKRVCPAITKGKGGYFTSKPSAGSIGGSNIDAATIEECQKFCISHGPCTMLDYDHSKKQKCYIHDNIMVDLYTKKGVTTQLIIRCDPELSPRADFVETVVSVPPPAPARPPAPTWPPAPARPPAEPPAPAAPPAPARPAKQPKTTTSKTIKITRKKLFLVIVIVILLTVLFVCLAAAYMKWASKQKEEAAEKASNEEREKLMETIQQKEIANKKSLMRMKSLTKTVSATNAAAPKRRSSTSFQPTIILDLSNQMQTVESPESSPNATPAPSPKATPAPSAAATPTPSLKP